MISKNKIAVNKEMFTLLFTPAKKHLQVLPHKCLINNVNLEGFEPPTS